MLAQAANGFELLQSIDRDILGACLILATIVFFGSLIVGIAAFSSTVSGYFARKQSNELVLTLIKQGHSIDDIERVVFHQSKKKFRNRAAKIQRGFPARPPVKQTATA